MTAWVVVLGMLVAAAASPQDSSRREPPQELDGIEVVKIIYPAGTRFLGWQLGHELSYDAEENPVTVKRFYWKALAEAFNSVPMVPEGKVEHRDVAGHDVFIGKAKVEKGRTRATLYLPSDLVRPQSGRFEITLDTSFDRSRVTYQEITSWPLRFAFNFTDELRENRTLEVNSYLERTLIREKNRDRLEDEEGNEIRFIDIETETIQDSRAAGIEAAYYWLIAPSTRVGRVDMGLSTGVTWEQDRLNLVESRLQAYVGINLKLTSKTVDDLFFEVSTRFGGYAEKYILLDELYDDDGNAIGTVETIEENRLPTWQVAVAGTAPLYRHDQVTMILFEGEATYLQSFEKTGGDSGLPETTERIATVSIGVTFQTPMGASLGVHGQIESYELPGEAGRRIEDLQWDTGFTASMTLTF
ncbi:MAG: hypothetical protein GY856_09390 [bacterium]|nr:hypothetical protein [bacterium]